MKKILNLTLIIFIIGLMINCGAESKTSDKTKAENTAEVSKHEVEKPKKKKAKTDPLVIIEKAPKGVTAKTVVENYFKAIGGEDKAKKVKTLCIVSEIKSQSGSIIIDSVKYAKPNKVYMSSTTKKTKEVFSRLAYDSKSGYSEYEGERVSLKPEDIKEFSTAESEIFPDFDIKKGKLLGIAEVSGDKAYVIKYESNKKAYYNVNSGLKVMAIEVKIKKDGKTESISRKVIYSDYKDVDGLLFPFNVYEKSPGIAGFRLKRQEIFINSNVSPKDFK